MARNPLDIVGEFLMLRVRDKSIEDWEKILDGRMKGQMAEKVRQEFSDSGSEVPDVVKHMVPRIVDTVLHHLLWTLEQEQTINLSIEADGTITPSIREVSDGLSGELYGERGWIVKFSQKQSTVP